MCHLVIDIARNYTDTNREKQTQEYVRELIRSAELTDDKSISSIETHKIGSQRSQQGLINGIQLNDASLSDKVVLQIIYSKQDSVALLGHENLSLICQQEMELGTILQNQNQKIPVIMDQDFSN